MLSAQKKRIEKKSAKKRARQEKRWVFPVALVFCVLFFLLGAGAAFVWFSPRGFSDGEVDAYVHSVYGPSWSLQKKTGGSNRWNIRLPLERKQGEAVSYLYAGGEGGSFTVFTFPEPEREDGVPTGRYRPALYDNYFSTVIDSRMDSIRTLAENAGDEAGLVFETDLQGAVSGIRGAGYTFRLYLEDREQLREAAAFVAGLDDLLSFSRGAGEGPWSRMCAQAPVVHVYLKPQKTRASVDAVSSAAMIEAAWKEILPPAGEILAADWKSPLTRDSFEISAISLTDRLSEARLSENGLYVRLENDYVDAAKTGGRAFYSIPEDLWNKYPAPVLTLVNAGGHDLPEAGTGYTYQFLYHRRTGTYWMTGLDPCEDFAENPAGAYGRRGAFAALVRYLGGTYTGSAWTGTWRIGNEKWSASLKTQRTARSPRTYEDLKLIRNGSITPLDSVPEIFAAAGATPSGRPYSIRDLIRMLDVRITINQKDMTAVMFRDIASE